MAMMSRLNVRAARLLLRSSPPLQPWRALSSSATSWSCPTSKAIDYGELAPGRTLIRLGSAQHVRHMTSDLSALPDIKDNNLRKALNALLGSSWLKVEPEVRQVVESALSSSSEDSVGKDALTDAWRSAQAIEKFGGILTEILMELNDLSGPSGEDVKPIPDSIYKAVEAAHKKYCVYLDSFGDDEAYLKKKVENEVGGVLLQMKQRLTGMDPKWSKITLLGTSGISGSYIERRGIVG